MGAGGGRKERKAGCGDSEGSGSQWKLQSGAQGTVLDGGTGLELAQELSGTAVPCHGNPGVGRSPGQHRLGGEAIHGARKVNRGRRWPRHHCGWTGVRWSDEGPRCPFTGRVVRQHVWKAQEARRIELGQGNRCGPSGASPPQYFFLLISLHM